MSEDEFRKLPYYVRRVINRVRDGEILCFTNLVNRLGKPELLAHFEPSGISCSLKSAEGAAKSGLLKPGGDCLLDESFSQTWTAAP
jgi:hypothetical protein